MLHNMRQLYGNKLGASDGEIGHVRDVYFDDKTWAIRYLVAETGLWLAERQVLLSPHAFGAFYQPGKLLLVKLTRKQIENSPAIELHKPVSRQYEEDYYRYYGWPYYWQGDGLSGTGGFSPGELLTIPSSEPTTGKKPRLGRADTHLRSTQAITGYHVHASDGIIGHICDFTMDDKSWSIRQLVIETGPWLLGKQVQISTDHVDRISYQESTVFVNVTKAVLEHSSAQHLTPANVKD